MKITLIRPQLGLKNSKKYDSQARMEPTALAVLAGLTPQNDEVVAYDDRFEHIPFSDPTDLVGISICTYSARCGYEIASTYRSKGIPVVIGGFHPTLLPDEGLHYADSVAQGEAESIWPQIVEDARLGQLKPLYKAEKKPSLAGSIPDWSIFKNKTYAPISSIQYGRGCRHTCDFCSIRAFYKGAVGHRPIPDVLIDIKNANRKRVFFVDDNFVSNPQKTKEFLRAIIPLRLSWTSQVDIRCVNDPELFDLIVRSGCQCLIIGFESLKNETLAQMSKKWANAKEYRRQLKMIRDHGIMVYGTFVFGYDNDKPEDIKKTLEFALEQKLFLANFNSLYPFPGTPLYKRLLQENRLTSPKWWLDPDFRFGDVVFKPLGMTAQELAQGCIDARMEFNRPENILRRMMEFKSNSKSLSNAFIFLLANLSSRSDILRKVGMQLGEQQAQEHPYLFHSHISRIKEPLK